MYRITGYDYSIGLIWWPAVRRSLKRFFIIIKGLDASPDVEEGE